MHPVRRTRGSHALKMADELWAPPPKPRANADVPTSMKLASVKKGDPTTWYVRWTCENAPVTYVSQDMLSRVGAEALSKLVWKGEFVHQQLGETDPEAGVTVTIKITQKTVRFRVDGVGDVVYDDLVKLGAGVHVEIKTTKLPNAPDLTRFVKLSTEHADDDVASFFARFAAPSWVGWYMRGALAWPFSRPADVAGANEKPGTNVVVLVFGKERLEFDMDPTVAALRAALAKLPPISRERWAFGGGAHKKMLLDAMYASQLLSMAASPAKS